MSAVGVSASLAASLLCNIYVRCVEGFAETDDILVAKKLHFDFESTEGTSIQALKMPDFRRLERYNATYFLPIATLLWGNYYVIIGEMFKRAFANAAQFGVVFNSQGVVMLRILFAVAFFCCMSLLSGCASIVNGQNQPVSVDTPNCAPAKCELTNDKGSWFVTTPGSVTVRRAFGDMTVVCTKAGLPAATLKVQSSTKAMAFGNIIFGGVIGAGVDVSTGAAYDYPALISVDMACNSPAASGTVTPAADAAIAAQPAK